MNGCGFWWITLLPTSLTVKKKFEDKSRKWTFSESWMTTFIPARTMFLTTSTLRPRSPTINTFEVWIRLCASAPHTRIWRSYRCFSSSDKSLPPPSLLLLLLLLLDELIVSMWSGTTPPWTDEVPYCSILLAGWLAGNHEMMDFFHRRAMMMCISGGFWHLSGALVGFFVLVKSHYV